MPASPLLPLGGASRLAKPGAEPPVATSLRVVTPPLEKQLLQPDKADYELYFAITPISPHAADRHAPTKGTADLTSPGHLCHPVGERVGITRKTRRRRSNPC